MTDEVEYDPDSYKYVYESPKKRGFKRVNTKRRLFFNDEFWEYISPNTVCVKQPTHPNWLNKTITIVMFPVSVIMAGFSEAASHTYRNTFDRRTGSFVEHMYHRPLNET